ncbi:MAG: hypothetical protein ACOYUZ_00645 [Patescibacteria group bacterium]
MESFSFIAALAGLIFCYSWLKAEQKNSRQLPRVRIARRNRWEEWELDEEYRQLEAAELLSELKAELAQRQSRF